MLPGFGLDADAMLATQARVIYLCRPNNPTGTVFERTAMERVMAEARGVVLIDEAYADFAADDLVQAALDSGRAVILRTMSKVYGLAGLRVGFAVGPAALIAEIEKSRGPYKVGGLAEAAAVAVLRHSADWVRDCIVAVRRNRARLEAELARRGFRFWPSSANFLLVQVPAELGDAASLTRALRRSQVQVRPFPALPQAGECIRVSVGPWPMMQGFLDALDAARHTPDAPQPPAEVGIS
jgi:histidinol-phosphate aminotransferase